MKLQVLGDDHVTVSQVKWQGLVPVSTEIAPDLFIGQHTYTPACDGFHEPGQCPRSQEAKT